jgi:flagellar hook-length control protein FliK
VANLDQAQSAHRPESAAAASRSAEQPAEPQVANQTATMGINAARMIQTMNGSEMRVGIHSADLGEVSISTSVSQQHMTAVISVDHSDLGKAILAYIPSMKEKFGEMGLNAAVEVSHGASSSSDGNHGNSSYQQKSTAPMNLPIEAVSSEQELSAMPVAMLDSSHDRLDIQA